MGEKKRAPEEQKKEKNSYGVGLEMKTLLEWFVAFIISPYTHITF